MIELVVAAVTGYLLGSIPVGLLVARRVSGVDVREYGSGKTGFTNTLRVLGLKRSVPVFAGDFGKGALAVLLPLVYTDEPWARAIGAVAAVAGHVWPVFAGFRGGRGVLAGLGALAALDPAALIVVVPVAGLTLMATKYMSATSIAGCVSAAVVFVVFATLGWHPWSHAFAAVTGAALIVLLHRDNIKRLMAGTEPRVGRGGQRRSTA